MEIVWLFSVLGGILSWLYNEIQKRRIKLLTEKEKRYENLIRLIRSLGETDDNIVNGNKFIVEFQLCWMYCPDNIITSGNQFLDSMNREKVEIDQNNINKLKGEFILELRKDLMKMSNPILYLTRCRTKLKYDDFRDVIFRPEGAVKR